MQKAMYLKLCSEFVPLSQHCETSSFYQEAGSNHAERANATSYYCPLNNQFRVRKCLVKATVIELCRATTDILLQSVAILGNVEPISERFEMRGAKSSTRQDSLNLALLIQSVFRQFTQLDDNNDTGTTISQGGIYLGCPTGGLWDELQPLVFLLTTAPLIIIDAKAKSLGFSSFLQGESGAGKLMIQCGESEGERLWQWAYTVQQWACGAMGRLGRGICMGAHGSSCSSPRVGRNCREGLSSSDAASRVGILKCQ